MRDDGTAVSNARAPARERGTVQGVISAGNRSSFFFFFFGFMYKHEYFESAATGSQQSNQEL